MKKNDASMIDYDEDNPALPPMPNIIRSQPTPSAASADDSPLLALVLAEVQRHADQHAACLASTATNNAIIAADPDSSAAKAILKRRAHNVASKARARERKQAERKALNARYRRAPAF